MISQSYDINEFIQSLKGKNYGEIILLADREALEAWRRTRKGISRGSSQDMTRYENTLKGLIEVLRYEIRPHSSGLDDKDLSLLLSVREGLPHRFA